LRGGVQCGVSLSLKGGGQGRNTFNDMVGRRTQRKGGRIIIGESDRVNINDLPKRGKKGKASFAAKLLGDEGVRGRLKKKPGVNDGWAKGV